MYCVPPFWVCGWSKLVKAPAAGAAPGAQKVPPSEKARGPTPIVAGEWQVGANLPFPGEAVRGDGNPLVAAMTAPDRRARGSAVEPEPTAAAPLAWHAESALRMLNHDPKWVASSALSSSAINSHPTPTTAGPGGEGGGGGGGETETQTAERERERERVG